LSLGWKWVRGGVVGVLNVVGGPGVWGWGSFRGCVRANRNGSGVERKVDGGS